MVGGSRKMESDEEALVSALRLLNFGLKGYSLFQIREFRWLMETEYQVKVTAIERLMLDLSTRFACVLQPTAGQLL